MDQPLPALHFEDLALRDLLSALPSKPSIDAADVVALRHAGLALGLRTRQDAEIMVAAERNPAKKCREWEALLVECLVDYAVWGERPTGALTESQAIWLCDLVGEQPSPACLAVLVTILEDAETMPDWFAPAVRLRAGKVFGSNAWQPNRQAA